MTVKELIEQLQTLDPDLHVFVSGYEGGYNDASPVCKVEDIALNYHTVLYYCKHEVADEVPDKTKYTIVKGIIL